MEETDVSPEEQAIYLYEHVPHWYAKLEGPIPPGGDERVVLQLTYMVFPTRDAAEEHVWRTTKLMCDQVEWKYDPEQWDLLQLVAVNAN